MEILCSIFIGKISSKIVGMIVGIVLQCRRDIQALRARGKRAVSRLTSRFRVASYCRRVDLVTAAL